MRSEKESGAENLILAGNTVVNFLRYLQAVILSVSSNYHHWKKCPHVWSFAKISKGTVTGCFMKSFKDSNTS